MSQWSVFQFFKGNESLYMADDDTTVAGASTNEDSKSADSRHPMAVTTSPRGTHTHPVNRFKRVPSLAILTLRTGSTSEKLIRSRLPELVAVSTVFLTLSITALMVTVSLALDYPAMMSWWVAFIPVWVGFPIAAFILGYSILSPMPYLEQLRALRSLQTGNNPSAVELIPMMIGAVGGVFSILLLIIFSIILCSYLIDSISDLFYVFIPLFVLHVSGILYAILVVDFSVEFLLLHVGFLTMEVLLLIKLEVETSLHVLFVTLPIIIVCLINFLIFFTNFLASLKHILEVTEGEVDVGSRWKWAFLSFQYFWILVFLVILFIKLDTDWLPATGFGYVTCFVALELSFLSRIGHDLIVIYKHLEPARLNPTFLDVVIV
jgi:hypothetical protein